MKAKELATKDVKDLKAELADSRRELASLEFGKTTKPLPQHRKIRALKKDIARMLTIISQKSRETKEVK